MQWDRLSSQKLFLQLCGFVHRGSARDACVSCFIGMTRQVKSRIVSSPDPTLSREVGMRLSRECAEDGIRGRGVKNYRLSALTDREEDLSALASVGTDNAASEYLPGYW